MTKTLLAMTAEIRQVNIDKGWRSPQGGPGQNTWGDYIALLHSELSEALEAYRDHRLADATDEFGPGPCSCAMSEASMNSCSMHGADAIPKPEGVGSELADVLIRLLDTADVFDIEMFRDHLGYRTLGDIRRQLPPFQPLRSFGDWIAYLHERVSDMWAQRHLTGSVLRSLLAMTERFEIDLEFEYERKIAYNRIRSFQHGGRTLADTL